MLSVPLEHSLNPGLGQRGLGEKKGPSQARRGKVQLEVKKNDYEGHCALLSLHVAKWETADQAGSIWPAQSF